MRRLRKLLKKGDVDPAFRDLIQRLEAFDSDLAGKENCQDCADLFAAMAETAADLVDDAEREAKDPQTRLTQGRERIGVLLRDGLPLPTKGTPGCSDCGMCEDLERRMRAWLDTTAEAEHASEPESDPTA